MKTILSLTEEVPGEWSWELGNSHLHITSYRIFDNPVGARRSAKHIARRLGLVIGSEKIFPQKQKPA